MVRGFGVGYGLMYSIDKVLPVLVRSSLAAPS
jgi:hypothetical protein